MLAEAGLAALWLAAAMALAQFLLGVLAARPAGQDYARAIAPVATAQAGLVAIAFACLVAVFAQSDMSVLLVASNSHSAKPMLYKIAGSWGNHEGSMLLWVTVLGLAGAAIARFEHRLRADTKAATLAAQGMIALGFYAFLLFASNPFARISGVKRGTGAQPDVAGPRPRLPPAHALHWLCRHVGGILVRRRRAGHPQCRCRFARAMRPWVLGAWVFLTLGITAGSYWAYYTLGWGGWWFWDPVENASLMPWLAATALLHSVNVLATRDALRAWTVMLAVLAFSMSMVGTFLVRSGVLTSVHSFAVDPTRGIFILALLAIYIGGALTLFALRVGTVSEGKRFEPVSREAALVANNLLLTVILVIVMAGTLYPLALEGLTGAKISVGAPYFNSAAGAGRAAAAGAAWRRAAAALAIRPAGAAIAPALPPRWRQVWRHWQPLSFSDAAPGSCRCLASPLPRWSPSASLAPLWKRNLRRTPLFTWGMVIAHLGCAVSIAGMASDSAFTRENMVAVAPGETRAIGPFTVTFAGLRELPGPNYAALEGLLVVSKGTSAPFVMAPQLRQFRNPPMLTNQAAIRSFWNGQLYINMGEKPVPGDKPGEARWLLRMWWKPFVTLFWLGGVMIALGGALALLGRVRRDHASARRLGGQAA